MMMRQTIHRHVGVRAEGMILAAAIWCLIGMGSLWTVTPSEPAPSVWHLLIPAPITVLIWVATGLLAAILALHDDLSSWGLGLLTIAPTIRLMSYGWAWLMDLVPGPPPGDPRGWYSALFYALMIAYVILLSHVPANVRPPLSGRRR